MKRWIFTVCIYIYPTPPPRVRCETTFVFQLNLTGLNSVFYFSLTSCRTKVKEISLPYYLSISWESSWIHTFPKDIITFVKRKQPHPGFELELPCSFPTILAITPLAHPDVHCCTIITNVVWCSFSFLLFFFFFFFFYNIKGQSYTNFQSRERYNIWLALRFKSSFSFWICVVRACVDIHEYIHTSKNRESQTSIRFNILSQCLVW